MAPDSDVADLFTDKCLDPTALVHANRLAAALANIPKELYGEDDLVWLEPPSESYFSRHGPAKNMFMPLPAPPFKSFAPLSEKKNLQVRRFPHAVASLTGIPPAAKPPSKSAKKEAEKGKEAELKATPEKGKQGKLAKKDKHTAASTTIVTGIVQKLVFTATHTAWKGEIEICALLNFRACAAHAPRMRIHFFAASKGRLD